MVLSSLYLFAFLREHPYSLPLSLSLPPSLPLSLIWLSQKHTFPCFSLSLSPAPNKHVRAKTLIFAHVLSITLSLVTRW